MNQLKKNLIDDFGYQNPKVPIMNDRPNLLLLVYLFKHN